MLSVSQLDNKTGSQNSLLLRLPQEYTNKEWRSCWKGTNVSSITMTIISVNVNLHKVSQYEKFNIFQNTINAPLN